MNSSGTRAPRAPARHRADGLSHQAAAARIPTQPVADQPAEAQDARTLTTPTSSSYSGKGAREGPLVLGCGATIGASEPVAPALIVVGRADHQEVAAISGSLQPVTSSVTLSRRAQAPAIGPDDRLGGPLATTHSSSNGAAPDGAVRTRATSLRNQARRARSSGRAHAAARGRPGY